MVAGQYERKRETANASDVEGGVNVIIKWTVN